MNRISKIYIAAIFFMFLLFQGLAYSAESVEILFIWENPQVDWPTHGKHWYPGCEACEVAQEQFLEKNETMTEIQQNYTGKVSVRWIWWYSSEGMNARLNYSVIVANSIVLKRVGETNYTLIMNSTWNVPKLIEIINAYIEIEPPPSNSPMPLTAILIGAFSFGFFETFSPCLIILLSFVLSYSIGNTTRFKEGFLKVLTFGIGFIFATVIVFLGSAGLIMMSSMLAFQDILLWIICVLAVFIGFDLLGISVSKFLRIKLETKPLIQKLSRKFVFTYVGLVLLGFLFYFLDPCIAPIFVIMVGAFQEAVLAFLPLVLFVFCLGVLVPFIGIGFVAGSISKLARSAYRHKSMIRGVSGMILMGYAFYFISLYLIRLDIITSLTMAVVGVTLISILVLLVLSKHKIKNIMH